MKLVKHEIKGSLGQGVVYQLNGLCSNQESNNLQWNSFRFYTPQGKQTDQHGFHYFDVPADSIPVERDDTLDKILIIMVTQDKGIEVLEIFAGAEMETTTIGLEGDIIATVSIPANEEQEIMVNYKEVIHG